MARRQKPKRSGIVTMVFLLILVMYALWMLSASEAATTANSAPEADSTEINQRLSALQVQVEARDKILHDR
jgi:hypothetical protein